MMNAEVRRATAGDATIVALLGRVTFTETFGYLFRKQSQELRSYLDATFGIGKIKVSLGKLENAYWLTFRDCLPVGYAKLKHPSAPPGKAKENAAQLQKIYVLKEILGERIGEALLQPLSVEAKLRTPTLWLDVLHENGRAIRFYKKYGFVVTGHDTYTIGSQTFQFDLLTTHLK